MNEFDKIEAQISDGIEGTRLVQIELHKLLHRFRNDARASQIRAKLTEMELLACDWLDVERRFRREYGDEDDPPRAFSVW